MRRNKKTVFSFVVDGECELWYLQLLKQEEKLNVYLEPKIPQKKKLKEQFKDVEELTKESKKVFWIVDFDDIVEKTNNAKTGSETPLKEFEKFYNKCKNKKYKDKIVVIINNPCLEFWFLLHFEQTTKYYETYEKLEKPLKKCLSGYEKKEKYYKNRRENIYQKLNNNLQKAISNSEKLGEFDFENIKGIAEMYKIFNELNLNTKLLQK